MAPLTNEDNILIKTLTLEKGRSVLRMKREFPSRKQKKSTLCNLIKRIDATGKIDQQKCIFNIITGTVNIYANFRYTAMQVLHFFGDKICKLLTYHTPFYHNHCKVINIQKWSSFLAHVYYIT